MNALTVPAGHPDDVGLRPVPWHRMAGVTWRQHRYALGGVIVLLGGLALYLWLAGLPMHHAYASAAGCRPAGSFGCQNQVIDFTSSYSTAVDTVADLLQMVPALIGAFVGAPVLARELETGTFRYAWTQGIGRRHWSGGTCSTRLPRRGSSAGGGPRGARRSVSPAPRGRVRPALLCETGGVSDDRTPAAGRLLADLQAAIADTEAIIAGISAGQWAAPTPCSGVDVRGLVNHLVAGNLYFAALITGGAVPDGDADLLGAEPAEAFRAAAASLVTALGDPGVLDGMYPLPFGPVPGADLIEIRLTEHLGHGWDLARATGQPVPFPDDLAERGLAVARRQLRNRPAGAHRPFGPAVAVPAGAPAIDRLAGFLGRGG